MTNKTTSPQETLRQYLDARRALIYMRTADFSTADDIISEVCGDKHIIEEYTDAAGRVFFKTKYPRDNQRQELGDFLELFLSERRDQKSEKFVVVLKEVHEYLGEKRIYSLLQQICLRNAMAEKDPSRKNKYNVTIIIVDSKLTIPPELEKQVSLLEIPYPDQNEVHSLIDDIIGTDIPGNLKTELSAALRGLTEFEIRQILNLVYAKQDGDQITDDNWNGVLKLVQDEKRQVIRKSGLVELIDIEGTEEVGGLQHLQDYLKKNIPIFENPAQAEEFGVGIPAGVMIVGMPGCGKSLSAKCTAKMLKVPLLRLDVGRLLGKYVGESEENLRRAIQIAESAAPCVLWIDEIEKAFAGIGSEGDGGVTTRMFGHFLTWMQEKRSCVFVIATANDISHLPPEFLRRGRFDEIFQVKFPTKEERAKILKIHLERCCKNGNPISEDAIQRLAAKMKDSENYSGADICSIVKESLKQLFIDNKKRNKPVTEWSSLTEADLGDRIDKTPSSYHSQKDKLDKMLELLKKYDVISAS